MRDLNTHLTKKHGPRKKPAKPRAGDLMQHAVDGMPQCRHCSAKFTRFEALQKHILGGCPSLFPDNAGCGQAAEEQTVEPLEAEGPSRVGEAKGSSPTVPCTTDEPSQMPVPVPPTSQHVALFDDPAFRGQLQTAWRQAFSHERYKHSLRTYCVFCGQWLALKGPSVKQHMRLSHPDRWRLKSDAESCCSSAGFISSVPCHYCGQDFKAPRSHIKHCPALFQAALAHQAILLDGDGGHAPSGGLGGGGCSVGQNAHADGGPGCESRPGQCRAWHRPQTKGRPGKGNPLASGTGLDSATVALMKAVTKMALRHEEELSRYRVDTNFMMFIDMGGEHSVLPTLQQAANAWQEAFSAGTVTMC